MIKKQFSVLMDIRLPGKSINSVSWKSLTHIKSFLPEEKIILATWAKTKRKRLCPTFWLQYLPELICKIADKCFPTGPYRCTYQKQFLNKKKKKYPSSIREKGTQFQRKTWPTITLDAEFHPVTFRLKNGLSSSTVKIQWPISSAAALQKYK